MVSITKINALDFNTIEEYFQYIIDSIINGQKNQAIILFEDLSKEQKMSFYKFIEEGRTCGLSLYEVIKVVTV